MSSACRGDKLHQTGEELGQVTNGSPDPKQRSWAQVGGFMYHFARVEQKINQAVIKLTELDAKSAPVVELIDFAKKVRPRARPSPASPCRDGNHAALHRRIQPGTRKRSGQRLRKKTCASGLKASNDEQEARRRHVADLLRTLAKSGPALRGEPGSPEFSRQL